MWAFSNVFSYLTRITYNRTPTCLTENISCIITPKSALRTYSDKKDVTPKQVVQGAANIGQQLRVRRAQPTDVPRVLRFVRERAHSCWPGLFAPSPASHLVLCDYVARTLAQGHSMVAELRDSHQAWSQITGVALNMAVVPWDASMLEKWASCIRCSRSKKLMLATAHCLRAPALHDKHHVEKILQVTLIVPPDIAQSNEIVHVLANNAIQRGLDVGFSVMRFDVIDRNVGKALEELKVNKEWELNYDYIPEDLKMEKSSSNESAKSDEGGLFTVYTAFPKNKPELKN